MIKINNFRVTFPNLFLPVDHSMNESKFELGHKTEECECQQQSICSENKSYFAYFNAIKSAIKNWNVFSHTTSTKQAYVDINSGGNNPLYYLIQIVRINHCGCCN